MIQNLAKKVFGSGNDREIKRIQPLVQKINSIEPQFKNLSVEQLAAKTNEFRERIEKGESLDSLLPEAFAVTREMSVRILGMRHFDVQLVGGIVLHQGKVAEMKTGEGKTLAATLPVYLNALSGKGVHVVTVNDYLAKRDSEWMGEIYTALGLTVGNIVHGLEDPERQQNYAADVTYGTNNEFGFDYLRDNMKFNLKEFVQRDLNYAIVDEVDSILIDEARTPLIISGPSEMSTDKYNTINSVIPGLRKEEHFTVDEKNRTSTLTEEGVENIEKSLNVTNLYAPENIDIVHHVHQALKAHTLFKIDVDYVVNDDQVIIVDEFTGRLMPGRRFSDGLHQALEAKESVKIEKENQTLATITFQNFFRMYNKLSGMTGTADTEAEEFQKIYSLAVTVIPTNKPMIRDDQPDLIYKTEEAKINAICEDVAEMHEQGKPILIGTVSIDKSEMLSAALKKHGIVHNVLNAKQHDREADIVKEAGHAGAITIATAMAGRGTDIVLGEGIKESGGLNIIGNERHESRRIDNQFRGRAGRQGDPGSSRFYLSLEDDLLRIFQGDKIKGYMDRLKMEEDIPIEHKMISKAIENAQKKVEAHNFDIRKHLIQYDDVLNKQREVVYELRKLILDGKNIRELVTDIVHEQISILVEIHASAKLSSEWEIKPLEEAIDFLFGSKLGLNDDLIREMKDSDHLAKVLIERAEKRYEEREKELTVDIMRQLEEWVYLGSIDHHWKEHLLSMDHLKEGVGLRGYGQKDPLVEYKKEGFELFKLMDEQVKTDVINKLYRIQITRDDQVDELQPKEQEMHMHSGGEGEGAPKNPTKRTSDKVGRNDPCPCGSGKKYKKCHGK